MSKEIRILGSGPSGLVAAITLAKNDFKVKIYEKEKNIGLKHNHISAMRNYEDEDLLKKFKKMNLKLTPSKLVKNVIRYSPSGLYSKTISKKPIFYLFNRGLMGNSLEKQLLKQAIENNVEIFYNSKKTIRGADVVATGSQKIDILGYGKIYEGNLDDVILFYNNTYAPKGYFCILPSKNEFEIMAVTFDKNEFKSLETRFENAVKKNNVLRKITKNCRIVKTIGGCGNYFMPIGFRNNKYYIGEAGGFQDAARGFGLWYAIITGFLAAKSIIEKSDYNEKWERELLNEIKESMKRRKIFNQFSNKDFDNMIKKMGREIVLEDYLKKRKA